MNRVSLAFFLILFCAFSLMAQNIKLDVATPQPPVAISGPGTDAQQVMSIVGGKGGNASNGVPGKGSTVLIQAGDGGNGSGGVGSNGAGGSILLIPGVAGTGGDITAASGGVGIGTLTPQKMLSVQGGMNIDQGETNNGLFGLNPGGLTFGSNSGAGIASAQAVGSLNQDGLDFYTNGTKRMMISDQSPSSKRSAGRRFLQDRSPA